MSNLSKGRSDSILPQSRKWIPDNVCRIFASIGDIDQRQLTIAAWSRRATLHNVWALAAMICGPLGNRSKHRCLSQQPGFAGSSLRAMRCSCTEFCSPAAVPCRHFEAAQTIAVHYQQRRRCLLLLTPEPSSCHPVQNRSKKTKTAPSIPACNVRGASRVRQVCVDVSRQPPAWIRAGRKLYETTTGVA